jgi:hypothetical protein
VGHHALHPELPALDKVIDQIINATWKVTAQPGYAGEIQRVVNYQVLQQLMRLSVNKNAAGQVRAIAALKIKELQQWIATVPAKDVDWKAHYGFALTQIKSFEEKSDELTPLTPLTAPDGAPIGSDEEEWME